MVKTSKRQNFCRFEIRGGGRPGFAIREARPSPPLSSWPERVFFFAHSNIDQLVTI